MNETNHLYILIIGLFVLCFVGGIIAGVYIERYRRARAESRQVNAVESELADEQQRLATTADNIATNVRATDGQLTESAELISESISRLEHLRKTLSSLAGIDDGVEHKFGGGPHL